MCTSSPPVDDKTISYCWRGVGKERMCQEE
jgi:hypothetical protein